ncbi:MAG: hypothetical protein ABI472_12480 [Ginsengibacter sp.]
MVTIKYFLFYSFLYIGVCGCAQSKSIVTNMYGTYTVHLPGNVAVDKEGNILSARDTLNVIYIESASDRIQWTRAWKNDKAYSVLTRIISASSLDAGIDKITNKKVIVPLAKGNKLYQLQLIPLEENTTSPGEKSRGDIILEGSYNGKKIMQKITQLTELMAIPSV